MEDKGTMKYIEELKKEAIRRMMDNKRNDILGMDISYVLNYRAIKQIIKTEMCFNYLYSVVYDNNHTLHVLVKMRKED